MVSGGGPVSTTGGIDAARVVIGLRRKSDLGARALFPPHIPLKLALGKLMLRSEVKATEAVPIAK